MVEDRDESDRTGEPRTGGPRAYVFHLATLAGAGACGLGAVAFLSAPALALAGLLLTVAGLAAMRGRRSLLRPRALDAQLATTDDPGRQAEIRAAGAMMVGSLSIFFGLLAAALGLWMSLA